MKITTSNHPALRHREHAALPADVMQTLNLTHGQQVIIRRDPTTFALYTLVEINTDTALMGPTGQARLSANNQFEAEIDPQAVDPNATEQEARQGNKLLERLTDDGQNQALLVLAPHGGDIERHTDDQAQHVSDLLHNENVTCWRCQGWKPHGGAAARWHITSTEISPLSFPGLATIATRRFQYAVSFHGFTDRTRPDVLIGGAAPAPLKRQIQASITDALTGTGLTVELTAPGDRLGGTGPANLVNRLSENGIQLEQQPQARIHWQSIATAITDWGRRVVT